MKFDAERAERLLKGYLKAKREAKVYNGDLFKVMVDECGVSPQRAVRTNPPDFIAGVLATLGRDYDNTGEIDG